MSMSLALCRGLVLLEEHQLVRGDQGPVSEVHVVHLHLVRAEHTLQDHAVEPHAPRGHAAHLAPPQVARRQPVALTHLRTQVAPPGGRRENNRLEVKREKRGVCVCVCVCVWDEYYI